MSAALVLSTAVSASAPTNARLSHVHRPAIHDIVPDLSASAGASVRDYITDPIIAPERDRHRTAGAHMGAISQPRFLQNSSNRLMALSLSILRLSE